VEADAIDDYLRCKCGKIVCEIIEDKVIIKCRHCKRFVVIEAEQVKTIKYN